LLLKRIFCLLAFLALPCTGFCGEVVSLDQSKIRLSIAPGQTATGYITVENNSTEPKAVKVYLEDWYYLPPFDGSKEFIAAGGSKLSCADWITFSPADLTLGPYGKQKVSYTVKMPASVQGGRYACMFFENQMGNSSGFSGGVGVNVSMRLACLFYVESAGSIQLEAGFSNFSVKKTPKGTAIALDVTNKGNADMTCQGTYNMMDAQGMVQARGDLSTVYTFPGDTGTSSALWSLPLEKGSYDLVLTLDLGKAREEAGMERGPVLVKEARVEIGNNGEVIDVGPLK
jgi:hypothetical protein